MLVFCNVDVEYLLVFNPYLSGHFLPLLNLVIYVLSLLTVSNGITHNTHFKNDVKLAAGITLNPKNGIKMKLKARRR
ncbi:MAG TPA: hypothetical protein VE130_02940 [Nitrososphaeraceae archaeon]|nr:hypothetical protein [Nitrososphaeraceae archaeon]